jgi:hypothetical protein
MSASPHFTRNMKNGAYHKDLFKDEKRVEEDIVIRDGKTVSTMTQKAGLTQNLGSLFDKVKVTPTK